jgi:uncharacterized hydrophobic protein (TIGR00271 family)
MQAYVQKFASALVSAWQRISGAIVRIIDWLPRRFELSGSDKSSLWETIRDDSQYSRIYWLQMGLSALIASLGLLQNSVAVVIGAMLVAPLLRPMQGMAYGIASAQGSFFIKNARVLILSIGLSIGIGFLTTMLSPLSFETPEILARVSPNFLDLLIAVASAAIAFLALSFRSLSSSIAGVAMAASLVPPLAVTGLTLALGNLSHAWGSFFLFTTNLTAILLVGVLIFFLYGYRPHQDADKQQTAQRITVLLLLTIIISIPLAITLSRVAYTVQVTSKTQSIFSQAVQTALPQAQIVNMKVIEAKKRKPVFVSATLALPEGVDFFAENQLAISDQLSQTLASDVSLDITLVRTLTVTSRYDNSPELEVPQESYLEVLHRQITNVIENNLDPGESIDILTITPDTTINIPTRDVVPEIISRYDIHVTILSNRLAESLITGDMQLELSDLLGKEFTLQIKRLPFEVITINRKVDTSN